MATTDIKWRISGVELANCNCATGCPCQFNALPTSGRCEAVWAMRIDEGHFGDVRLDGLTWGELLWWPGAVHEGNGKLQIFGEERATAAQRAALEAIGHGKVSNEGTYFQIFSAVAPNFLPSVWAPIEFECDVDKRTGRLAVRDLVEASIEPMRNPVTNLEHRARVVLPHGFEYREAELARGSAKSSGSIRLNVRRVAGDATAWSARDATWSMVIAAIDSDRARADGLKAWGRAYWNAVRPFNLGGAYVNFMMDDEVDGRLRATYGENYARLASVKAKYDPANLFRVNQNIAPAAT